MKSNNRKQIPRNRADTILFEADRTCCICEDSSKPVQIHHLDGNSNNNATNNLVVLCLDHHHEASVGSGIGRGLTAGQIQKYHDKWLEKIHNKRGSVLKTFTINEESHECLLEALACHEIRKIKTLLFETEWDKQIPIINSLYQYSSYSYGYYARAEILYTLNVLADRTRSGMPVKIVSEIENLAFSTLPIISLVHRSKEPISENTKKLFRSSMEVGFSISYDGVKYLRNLKIVAAGARILSATLRYAHLNDLQDLKVEVLEEFSRLIDQGTEKDFEDAIRWLQFERDDALALDEDQLPNLPKDILEKLNIKEK